MTADHIRVTPAAETGKYLVQFMRALSGRDLATGDEDTHQVERSSQTPLSFKEAGHLAQAWAALYKCSVIGYPENTFYAQTAEKVEEMRATDLITATPLQACLDDLWEALAKHHPAYQMQALPLAIGMLLGDIEGHLSEADIAGRAFITLDDRMRLAEILVAKGLDLVRSVKAGLPKDSGRSVM